MAVYVPPTIEVDRDTIFQSIVDDLEAGIPNLEVAEGTLIWYVARIVASRHAQQLELLAARAQDEYQAYGEKVIRLAPIRAVSATSTITITAIDDAGYTMPSGTQLSVDDGNGGRAMFQTVGDATVAPGDTTLAGVSIAAVEAGTAGNALYLDPVLEQPLAWVDALSVDSATSNGADAETAEEYVDRLTEATQLLGTTLTIPSKFALGAQTLAGVDAALAIDLYKPGPPYDGSAADDAAEGHITVAVRDENGDPVTTPELTAVQDFLDANTVSFMQPWAINPTYNDIDVVFAGVAADGYDPATVEAEAEAAVLEYLSPARWGRPEFGGALTGYVSRWIDTPVVRFQRISAVLDAVPGLDHWTSLTINGGTSDVTMTGPAALPSTDSTAAGTIS
jgi:hypothetical protein